MTATHAIEATNSRSDSPINARIRASAENDQTTVANISVPASASAETLANSFRESREPTAIDDSENSMVCA